MMFIVALYLPWCRYLDELPGVFPQLHADNLKCVSTRPEQLLRAAQFTSAYVKLVGQEPAPSECILYEYIGCCSARDEGMSDFCSR